jgi:Domain of unknown function (DUF1990)
MSPAPDPLGPYRARLIALERARWNLDLERRSEYTAEAGWNIDQHEAELPPEPPGEPTPHGSFRAAQGIVREYRFPPPELITGIFLPDQPLETRVMLLRARFLFFTFYFGVRVGGVTDTVQDAPQGKERVWGYNYATLEGHFERGQIEFTIHKRLMTGEVTFRIRSFSRTGTITNVFYRIGFLIFGRALQRRFARESLRRMQMLVREALQHGQTISDGPSVEPADDATVREKLETASHSGTG